MTRPTDAERLQQMTETADKLHELADRLDYKVPPQYQGDEYWVYQAGYEAGRDHRCAEIAALLRELASSARRASSRVKEELLEDIRMEQRLGILPPDSFSLERLDEGQRQDLYAFERCAVLIARARAMADQLQPTQEES